ncbi:sugar (and other) transporter family protein [Pseudarthrobacter siccitolerans]|uniref:Sugar (And other) transporter family protein n=1 Tax=Pseudarthrobacter siccitolerans TaxID=861266 RepID=A0A024H8S9_9MICC|nr:MFS transporter [Pseudarthrobacter siccitolerans]CCQ48184.1 sugar (and other) transporter family protein [Pseudarthrobacter siccitolerans]
MTTSTLEQEGSMLDARLDRLPITKHHILWISVLGLVFFVETFDNVMFASLAPAIRNEWGLSIGEIGVLASSVFIGMFVGAVAGGRLSDRFGRRPALVAGCFVFGLGSLGSALAPSPEWLLAFRVITGVGMQAAIGVLMVMVSEMFPSAKRGRFFTVLTFIGFAGVPVTTFTALTIVPSGPSAWRWVFAIGGVGILTALIVLRFVPETVRWQVAHNRSEAATRTVLSLEKAAQERGKVLPQPQSLPPIQTRQKLRDLFRGKVLQRLMVMSSAFGIYLFCLVGFQAWIPTILTSRGMSQTAALQFASIVSLATIVGPVIIYFIADKIERKVILFVAAVITTVAMLTFAFVSDSTVSLIAAFAASMAATSMTVSFYTYIPEVFPTALRGVGVGAVNGAARVTGFLSGISVAAIYTAWGFQWLYVILAGLFLLAGTIILVFGTRTTNRSLEVVNELEVANDSADSLRAPIKPGSEDLNGIRD